MRQSLALVCLIGGVVGCGGSVSTPEGASGAAGASPVAPTAESAGTSAIAPAAAAGASAVAPATAANEPLDPPSGTYPDVPTDGGAFFWRLGLGNWFVVRSDGTHHDATFEALATGKVWKATSELGGTTDLWAQLSHPSGKPIDLSAYKGISFDARLADGSAQLVVAFSANGDLTVAERASAAQRFVLDQTWHSYELDFGDAGAGTKASSFDFIVATPRSASELQIRNVALSCKTTCP